MSSYIKFYIKNENKFIRLYSFSRNNIYYEFGENYVPAYSDIKPLTEEDIHSIRNDIKEELEKMKKDISSYKERNELTLKMNNSLSEKMEYINSNSDMIEYCNDKIEELNRCDAFYVTLLWLIQERKYRTGTENDFNDYVYAGIECTVPTIEDK